MDTAYTLFKASLDPVFFLLVLMAVGFFSAKKEGKRTSRTVLLTAFSLLYMAGIFPVSNALSYILENEYLQIRRDEVDKLDIVVVLGGGTSDNDHLKETMPSYRTTSRILYGVQMFRKSGAGRLICAGRGITKHSEAEVMAIAAERLGVPAVRITIDEKSRNTREHAEELNKIINEKDLKIGLVTSAYHMKRSEGEFKKYFPNITPLPSDYLYITPPFPLSAITFLPRSENFYKFSTVLHEIIGIAWYRIKGQP